jgi:ketosteroid isomerase-like protein
LSKKTVLCILAILVTLAGGTACGPREEATMDDPETMGEDQALNAFRDRLTSAFAAGDATGLAELFTEDAVLIPSVGQEVRGRETIEQTYAEVWRRWQVGRFELAPEEGKIVRDWAFERGSMTLQMLPRDSAVGQQGQQGQPGQPPATAGAPGRTPGQARPGTGGSQPSGTMLMNTSHYVFVMNKQAGDWRISWFISTNPPEFSTTVTSDAAPGAQTSPAR